MYVKFKDNICAADLAKSLSSKNWGVKYLFCIKDVFTKYPFVKPLKDQKAKTLHHYSIEILNKSKHKPNKLCTDQGKEFYNSLKQKWLDDNDTLKY